MCETSSVVRTAFVHHLARRDQRVGGAARFDLLGEAHTDTARDMIASVSAAQRRLPRSDHEDDIGHAAIGEIVQHMIEERIPRHRHQTLRAGARGDALRFRERRAVLGTHARAESTRKDHRSGRGRRGRGRRGRDAGPRSHAVSPPWPTARSLAAP